MSVASMTGFARVQGHLDDRQWTWEIKSVNGKGLDVRCRMQGLDAVETRARAAVAARFKRGNIALSLTTARSASESKLRVNEDLLDEVMFVMEQVRDRFPDAAAPTLDGLLALRGVIESDDAAEDESARTALEQAVLASLDQALDALAAARTEEGARTEPALRGHIDEIETLSKEAARLAATQPESLKARILEQLRELLAAAPPLPEDRLAQEVALLAAKADVREELDRLKSHVEAARALLDEGGAVGRRLDFLCQEFNREANTLCSKSVDVELTRVGLALKAAVEQLREQVQNIE